MNDRNETDEARLEEIRQRAREMRVDEKIERSEPRSRRADRGPHVSAWRSPAQGGHRDYGRYAYGDPGMVGYSGPVPVAYPMGGYPGYAGVPTPVGMPFEAGRPGGSGFASDPARRWSSNERERSTRETWFPRARVFERDGALIVRLELPGLERKDVEVRVEDQMLVVEGERPDDRPADGGVDPRNRWGYGPFRSEVALPHPVDADDVKARFRNGLLEVAVPQPRREERRSRIKLET